MHDGVSSKTLILESVRASSGVYGLPDDASFTYGTAGFRARAEVLPPVAYRMGLLAALRAKCLGSTIGVVITASHNPPQDNGLKIVEPQGEMLIQQWEPYATLLSNTYSGSLVEVLEQLSERLSVSLTCRRGDIIIARDTRASGPDLVRAFVAGATALECKVTDVGMCTTPQLHWIVKQTNIRRSNSLNEYYQSFSDAFIELLGKDIAPLSIKVDCANGVGAQSITKFREYLSSHLEIEVYNDGSHGNLNENCGADFVKLMQNAPHGISHDEGEHCYTIDGDADRVMFFFKNSFRNSLQFKLLDGDKIATLFATFMKQLLEESRLSLNIGVVQTAYANSASTHFLRRHGVPVACVPTGVKHLHRRAEEYDIGVYFEANGHGTVLFSETAMERIQHAAASDKASPSAVQLLQFTRLINSSVGDAITNILAIEAILRLQQLSPADWNNQYTDLPYRQLKVNVRDRNLIKTEDAERRVSEPVGLQDRIDGLVGGYGVGGARCFVRPSGTENCVRVHAECQTQREADKLAMEVGSMVVDFIEEMFTSKL